MEIIRKLSRALPFEEMVLVLVCFGGLYGYIVWMIHDFYQGIEEQNEKAWEISVAMEDEDYCGLRCGNLFLPKEKVRLVKVKEEVFVTSRTPPFIREKEVFVYKIFSFEGKFFNPKDCDPVFRDGKT